MTAIKKYTLCSYFHLFFIRLFFRPLSFIIFNNSYIMIIIKYLQISIRQKDKKFLFFFLFFHSNSFLLCIFAFSFGEKKPEI